MRSNCRLNAIVDRVQSRKQIIKYGLFVLLVLVFAFTVSGCRYSEALQRITTDQVSGEFEPRADPEYKDVDGAPEDPNKASTHLSNNDNLSAQVNMRPIYAADGTSPELADKATFDQTTNDNIEAASGTEASDEEGDASVSEEGEGDDASAGDDNKGEKESGEEGEGQVDETGGRGGIGKNYDDGTYDELPEARAVAAKGMYATITQMLGGKGALAATDSQWKKDMKAATAFPNEGVEDIAAVWTGTNGKKLNIDKLVDTHADVVLVDGVECTLTDAQSKKLKKAGISIVAVPTLGLVDTADKDIETAIKVVAQILSGANAEVQLDTAKMADQWIEFRDAVLEDCKSSNCGYSYKVVDGSSCQGIYQGSKTNGESTTELSDNRIITAFVDKIETASKSSVTADRSWGESPVYLNGETIDCSNGIGVSVSVTPDNFVLMDYYLQTAGVVNNAYEGAKPSDTATNGLTLPYAIIAGNAVGMLSSIGARNNSSALWLPINGSADWHLIGEDGFSILLTRDSTIADAIAKSASKPKGLYNVGQRYSIQVVPQGLAGSWADGTPESHLIALWAFEIFRGGKVQGDVATYMNRYYETFYRIKNATSSGTIRDLDTSREASCPRTD